MTKPKKVILRLLVPKLNERGPMAFEQVLASLHGLLSKNVKKFGEEFVTFEIAKIASKIYFFVVVPNHLRTLLRSQIYSQYPDVEIEEVSEIFTKKLIHGKKILAATLRPSEPMLFPFKRYPQFLDQNAKTFEDPIGPITSSLAHLHSSDDSAILQFVISPISPSWHNPAKKTLKKFFKSGPWQWDWFRHMFVRLRLDFSKNTRILKSPLWGIINILTGWSVPSMNGTQDLGEDETDSLDREEQTSLRHDRETVYSASYDKLSRLSFATNIRAIYIHSDSDEHHAEAKIREIAGTFQQFSLPQMNHFSVSTIERIQNSSTFQNIIHRRQKRPFALSQEELATIFHLPTLTVKTPGIQWVESKRIEPPVDLPNEKEKDVTLIGRTNFRDRRDLFGIRTDDRRRHTYIIGKTGMGKSTMLENMILSDIKAGK
ncbi:MAG: hypothetical protein OEL89_05420, partial [Candidatus Peregrinibacteria bacterium]|nr:hypothetical protein [Candidatus Peregrinibacteria bacterium]